jgi:hypothetical protein
MKTTLLLLCLALVSCHRTEQTSTTTESSSTTAPDSIIRDTVQLHDTVTTTSPQPSSDESVNGWKTYRNDRYHFEFQYPPNLTPSEHFSTVDILPKTWRAMATSDEPGTPVMSVPIVHITGRTSYPRFYDVEFRVGVSDSLKNGRATNGEKTIGTIVINGSTFNQFEFSDAAMMKYISGISYRTGHDGRCYAIEQLRVGSNYKDQPSKNDIEQNKLDEYYYLAGKIVKTFRFTDAR